MSTLQDNRDKLLDKDEVAKMEKLDNIVDDNDTSTLGKHLAKRNDKWRMYYIVIFTN